MCLVPLSTLLLTLVISLKPTLSKRTSALSPGSGGRKLELLKRVLILTLTSNTRRKLLLRKLLLKLTRRPIQIHRKLVSRKIRRKMRMKIRRRRRRRMRIRRKMRTIWATMVLNIR